MMKRMTLDYENTSGSEVCKECGSNRFKWDNARGEVICLECGLVIEEGILDRGPEWRSFQGDDRWKNVRGGPPIKYGLSDKGLSTHISRWDRDSLGRDLDSRTVSRFRRLRKWDLRKKQRIERRMTHGLADLARISAQLQIPKSVKESACLTFRQLVGRGFTQGKNTENVTASVIYLACRQAGIPRLFEEIAQLTRAKKKQIVRTYKEITRELGIHLPPMNPIELVPRFASRISLPNWVAARAIRLLEKEMRLGPSTATNPCGTAAAALYITSKINGFKHSQKEVSQAAHTTQVTLRKRIRDISEHLDIDTSIYTGVPRKRSAISI
jgi:transcription initiation factor TFIIB